MAKVESNNKLILLSFLVIISLQGFLLGSNFYGQFIQLQQGTGIDLFVGYVPSVTRVFAKFIILLFGLVIYKNWSQVLLHVGHSFNKINLLIHLLLYFGLYLSLNQLLHAETSFNLKIVYYLSYFLIALFWVALTSKIMVPWICVKRVIVDYKFILLIAFLFILFDQISIIFNFVIEDYFHPVLFEPTAAIAKFVLDLMGYQVDVKAELFQISTHNFAVEIGAPCLGYQGVSLALIFFCFYLYVMRRDFRFPQAFVVLPVAVLALWLLNSVRIAFLTAIGSSWSEDVAINGFHRVGGWINLIGVSLVMLFILHRTTWFSSINRSSELAFSINKENAQLIPQLTLIASTLLTLLFTGQFDWLYPLRVVLVGAVFVYLYKKIEFKWAQPDWVSLVLGVLVFFIWMAMVPMVEEKDAQFAQAAGAVPVQWLYVWIVFRVVGAVVIVPLAEELAFRGFIANRLKLYLGQWLTDKVLHWCTALISSLLFGFLHDAWLAGLVAGLIFYYAMNRRQQLSDAVIAHGVANLLISIYVLSTKHWSYW